MLSCAAIQKLERYGQLGLKRNSTEDFVASCLKDAKRTNIYALTHLPSWQECLESLRGSRNGPAEDTDEHARAPLTVVTAAPGVLVTDSLVYAVSFSTALVAHHLLAQLQSTVTTRGSQARAKSVGGVFGASDARDGSACGSDAIQLITQLKRVVVAMAQEGHRRGGPGGGGSGSSGAGCIRFPDTKEFAHSLAHLLSSVSVLLLYALAAMLTSRVAVREAEAIWTEGIVLLAACARLLRRMNAVQSQQEQQKEQPPQQSHRADESQFTARTATALVKQFATKHQQRAAALLAVSASASSAPLPASRSAPHAVRSDRAVDVCAGLQSFPTLSVLVRYVTSMARAAAVEVPAESVKSSGDGPSCLVAGGFLFFENFSLTQKLSLLHAAIPELTQYAEQASAEELTEGEEEEEEDAEKLHRKVPLFAADKDATAQQWRVAHTGAQRLLTELLAPVACSKATRYVIYYRGDDLKLMQSRVTQPSQYALHTIVTTPPLEPSVVEAFTHAVHTPKGTVPLPARQTPPATAQWAEAAASWHSFQCSFHALVFAQWAVSAPFFFEAFCSDSSWTAFAQEQRRMALLRQSQARRSVRDDRRRKSKKRGERDTASAHGDLADADDGESSERSSTHSSASTTSGGAADDADVRSSGTAASLATSRSLLSLESRASLLSTLSKQSAASYLSFLSVRRPTAAEDATASARLHESVDGNTNLPLILLEELVLALHRFMEALPAEELDPLGLRALCWSCIGRLFTLVQGSISLGTVADGAGAASTAATRAPMIFNLGTDLRYNHGLGYESLGLVFAKVIAPQFEDGEVPSSAGKASAGANGASAALTALPVREHATVSREVAAGTKRSVEAALSRCLTAFEGIAPQVVDMHLPVILRIAARTMADAARAPSTSSTTGVLYGFLTDITLRLGRCNQLNTLLDALVSSSSTSPTSAAVGHGSAEHAEPQAGRARDDAEDAEDVAALQVVFSSPMCRAALVQASGLSLDPENLLERMLTYITPWTLGDDSGARHDPQQVLFVLKLVATVLEGVRPSSMTSSAVLERATEMELLLAAFAVKRLRSDSPHVSVFWRSETAEGEETGVLRPKLRRQLWLHALYAVCECRRVTADCLADLGLQNVEDFLRTLNDSLWQFDTHVGALLPPIATAEEDDGDEESHGGGPLSVAGVGALSAQMSATTHMTLEPFIHVRALLPKMALQRLTAARAVATVLGVEVSPAEDARHLAQFALDAIAQSCECSAPPSPSALFVDDVTEAEWVSLVHFTQPKRLRATLVTLLRWTFSTSTTAPLASASYLAPVWLSRSLRCAGGVVLRSMTDLLLTYTKEDVTTMTSSDSAGPLNGRGCEFLALLTALAFTYKEVGHVPSWPLLAQQVVDLVEHIVPACATGLELTPSAALVTHRLLSLLHDCLNFEERAGEVFRRTLLLREGAREGAAERGSQSRRAISATFLANLGIAPVKDDAREGSAADDEPVVEDELTALAPELRQLATRLFTARFLHVLLAAAASYTGADADAGFDRGADHAMGILAMLHHTAVLTTRAACREGRYKNNRGDGDNGRASSAAAAFLCDVSATFLARLQAAPATSSPSVVRAAGKRSKTTVRGGRAGVTAAPACGDARRALSLFLRALCRLPMGSSALLAGLPQSKPAASGKRKSSPSRASTGEAETSVDPIASVRQMEHTWVCVLRHEVVALVKEAQRAARGEGTTQTSATGHSYVSPQRLQCLLMLYARLVESIQRGNAGGAPAAATLVAELMRKDSTLLSSAAAETAATAAAGGEHSDDTHTDATSFTDALCGLFSPAYSAADTTALQTSLSTMRALLLQQQQQSQEQQPLCSVNSDGVAALWLLYTLFSTAATPSAAVDAAAPAALLASALTHLEEWAAGAPSSLDAALAHCVERALPLSVKHHGRLTESAFSTAHSASSSAAVATAGVLVTRCACLGQALAGAVEALDLLGAAAAPPLLLSYVRAQLLEIVPLATAAAAAAAAAAAFVPITATSTSSSSPPSAGTVSSPAGVREQLCSYHLLCTAADVFTRLAEISAGAPGGRTGLVIPGPVRAALVQTICASTSPLVLSASAVASSAARGQPELRGDSLHARLLRALQQPLIADALCPREAGRPTPAPASAEVDAVLSFALQLLNESNRSRRQSTQPAAPAAGAEEVARAASAFALSRAELMELLAFLARVCVPRQVLWARASELPLLVSALFECVLLGLRDGDYGRQVVNQLSALFRGLVQSSIDAAEEAEDDGAAGDEATAHEKSVRAATPAGASRRASYSTRVLALTAAVTSLFQLSRYYIPVFTTFSSDLDFIARDFLLGLSQHYLPRTRGTPIAFHPGVDIQPRGPSPATYADLVYSCVGDAECKALLRQAALRLDEAEVEQGAGGTGLVLERRKVFNVIA